VEHDQVAEVARRFSQDAPLYERYWAPSLARLGRRLFAGLSVEDPGVIVDIGAGVGTLLPTLQVAAPRAYVAGVDAAEGMIRRASPSFGRAVMDARRLALRDASVDAALMPFMVFFLPNPSTGLEEVRRVLRPGGQLGVATWHAEGNEVRADEVWAGLLEDHGAASDPAPWNVVALDTPDRLAALLEETGFTDVRTASDREPQPLTLEEFLEVRTRMGRSKRSFESIAPAAREAVLTQARERLGRLRPDDFTDPQVAVFAWGAKRA
jgi:SAM-dependent methyltransferase